MVERRPRACAGVDGRWHAPEVARRAATHASRHYLELEHWEVFADTIPVLTALRAEGWRHAIVSNHVPELPELVDALGLTHLFDAVLTSGLTGYEKPHPEAFARGRHALGEPAELWMVGDNPTVDVEGADREGIRAILVRTAERARRSPAATSTPPPTSSGRGSPHARLPP